MNILMVDDDRFVIAALEKNIDWESLGITTVFTANDIGKAQEILSNQTVDLLLSDIDMPHGSGLDLLGILREQGNTIPAIFLTNYADFSYAKRASASPRRIPRGSQWGRFSLTHFAMTCRGRSWYSEVRENLSARPSVT